MSLHRFLRWLRHPRRRYVYGFDKAEGFSTTVELYRDRDGRIHITRVWHESASTPDPSGAER